MQRSPSRGLGGVLLGYMCMHKSVCAYETRGQPLLPFLRGSPPFCLETKSLSVTPGLPI